MFDAGGFVKASGINLCQLSITIERGASPILYLFAHFCDTCIPLFSHRDFSFTLA